MFLKVNPTISLRALSGRSTLTEYTDKPTTANGGSKRESNANHTLIRRNPCLAPHVYTFDVERLVPWCRDNPACAVDSILFL